MTLSQSLREARHFDKMFYIEVDDLFYEPVNIHYNPSSELSSLVTALIDERGKSWKIWRSGVWSHVGPPTQIEADLPAQGWKIHVSATAKNCHEILKKVAALTLDHDIRFKFANDTNTLKMMTSKRWPRGGSGKFITIYPCNDKVFYYFIERLYSAIKNDHGSYILSDNRYKDCRCLYYRYGGILQTQRLDFMGRHRPVLISPKGEEVIDDRTPYFNPPPWVVDPFSSTESEQPEMTLNEGRFLVKSALGFSNTGGVYAAMDVTSGKDVVIKEARPFVELHGDGRDAISRLQQEGKILRILDSLDVTPSAITTFCDWENFYLVEEYLDAIELREVMILNSPLLRANPNASDSENFYTICKNIFSSLLSAIERIHSLGVVIGDLSPANILVNKHTNSIHIIDFEAAYQSGIDDPSDIYTPGFRSSVKGRKKTGDHADDLYAAAAIMTYSMFPIVAISYVRDDLFTNILPVLLDDIGWSKTHLREIIHGLSSNTMTCARARELLDIPVVLEPPLSSGMAEQGLSTRDCYCQLAQFLLNNYRLNQKYTLFATDPFALHTNSVGLGFGSSGVVYALKKCGFDIPLPAWERYIGEINSIRVDDIPPGMLTGAAGIALALFEIGDSSSAERFVGFANSSTLLKSHHSLYYGMAGIGMANLAAHLRTGDAKYLDAALYLANVLAAQAIADSRGIHWEENGTIRLGMGYGQSGVALYFLRLSQLLNSDKWRELGLKAINYDLSYGSEMEPGVVTFFCSPDEDRTFEHYIEQGSAGIAKVAIRYGLWSEADKILHDVHRKYSGFPGLIYGLSGFLDVLVDAYLYSRDTKYLDMAKRPLQGIRDLYLIKQAHGYATPGDNLFRVSCDYATGVAGVMRALYRLTHLTTDDFSLDELETLHLSGSPY